MDILEVIRFVLGAIRGQRLRSFLSALGVAIGVTAVIVLTSLGEGTRDYIVGQFTQFGTSIIAINPGKVKTLGMPGVLGGTTHKLTIDDAEALRRIPNVEEVVPVAFGQARVEGGGRGRSVFVHGVGWEAAKGFRLNVSQGSFLPRMDPNRRSSYAVLGAKLAHELFDDESPLGKRIRIGGYSFLVIGVMESKGQMMGFDLDDTAYIPVATAMDIFDVDELVEIDVVASNTEVIPEVVDGIRSLLMERHRGEEDFTITTQTEMLDTFGQIIGMITIAVSGIAGISLLVGAIGHSHHHVDLGPRANQRDRPSARSRRDAGHRTGIVPPRVGAAGGCRRHARPRCRSLADRSRPRGGPRAPVVDTASGDRGSPRHVPFGGGGQRRRTGAAGRRPRPCGCAADRVNQCNLENVPNVA